MACFLDQRPSPKGDVRQQVVRVDSDREERLKSEWVSLAPAHGLHSEYETLRLDCYATKAETGYTGLQSTTNT